MMKILTNKVSSQIQSKLMMKEEVTPKLQAIEWEDFETNFDTSSTTFYLPNRNSDQARDQASDQAILEFCREAKSSSEIMQFIGMKHRTYFRNNILNPLIERRPRRVFSMLERISGVALP